MTNFQMAHRNLLLLVQSKHTMIQRNVTDSRFHPLLLILIRDTLLVRVGLDPFLCPDGSGGTFIELTQQVIEFWKISVCCPLEAWM